MINLVKNFCLVSFIFILGGCSVGAQKGHQESSPSISTPAPAPIINIPKAEIVDLSGFKADLRSEIQTSANSTQNQMSGLLNASVSKLSERITGVEASITTNATATVTATANLQANLQAKLENNMSLTNQMQTELKIRNEINAKVETELHAEAQLIKELSLHIGKLESTMQAQGSVAANAQVGWNNKFEQLQQQITSTAGRDVNMLPREAVYLLLGVVSLLCGLFSTGIYYAYRNARQREENTAKLLMKAVARLEPEKTKDFIL